MKKVFNLLALLLTTLWASAAGTDLPWTDPGNNKYPNSTVLYVQPNINGNELDSRDFPINESFSIAAFVGGECRAVATAVDGQNFYRLRVWGNSDDVNKPIMVKLFNNNLVYSKADFATFTGETNPTVPMPIIIDEPYYKLDNPINVEARLPYNFDLNDYVKVIYLGVNDQNTTKRDGAFELESQLTLTFGTSPVADFSQYLTVAADGKATALAETEENGVVVELNVAGPTYTITSDTGSQSEVQYQNSSSANLYITEVVQLVENIIWNGEGEPSLTVDVGDNVWDLIKDNITITPDDAANKNLNFTGGENGMPDGIATTPGDYEITVTAADGSGVSIIVKVHVKKPIALAFPDRLDISKYYSVGAKIIQVAGEDQYDPDLIKYEILKAEDPNGVEVTSEGGAAFSFLGKKVGTYAFRILYDGNDISYYTGGDPESIAAAGFCSLELPVEIKLPESGWDWIGGTFANGFSLMKQNENNQPTYEYLDILNMNANNKVIDMRSQTQLLYNDPTLGLFGDITSLYVGMYKVKANYESAENSIIRTDSYWWGKYDVLKYTFITQGYNWVAYPNEFDMTFAYWNANAGNGFGEGDMIYGINGVATVQNGQWNAVPSTFKLEAGKGYIYYCVEPDRYLNWGEVTEPEAGADVIPAPRRKIWSYDVTQHANNMALFASLEGIYNAGDYSIGAFVNGECRGEGRIINGNTALIFTTGEFGENVTFKLVNTVTGEQFDIPETVKLTQLAGSMKAPVRFTTPSGTTGITEIATDNATDNEQLYDLSGRRVNKNAKGILIKGGKKVVVK